MITGYQKVKLENGRIVKENPNMKLDMSAIAKGYTSDLIGDFLTEKRCKNYMVEIGGEVVAKGKNGVGVTVFVADGIEIVATDVMGSNGVIHVINTVVMPN